MKFITNVDEEKFNNFIKQNCSSFMQTSYFGEINRAKGLNYFLVGLEDEGKLVAGALVLEKNLIGKFNYLYIPRGFVLDFDNQELMKAFVEHLKSFGKKRKAIFITIDPEIIIKIDEVGQANPIKSLEQLGFHHLGYNYYFENRQPRFTYNLKLNDNYVENFHPTTKKIHKRGNLYNLDIYKGNKDDIDDFYNLMLETGDRKKATFFSKDYYLNFYNIFNQHNMSDIYIAKVNINELKEIYKKKITEIKNNLNKITKENKKKDLNDQLIKYQKEYDEIKEIKTNELVLSSIITVKFKDKVWTVHGGNSTKLRFLNSNYWLYFKIIEDAYNEGFKQIDFFGTIGKEDTSSNEYGIHLFKKRLGGNKIEYIGEFDLVLNKFIYFLYKKVYKKIK